MKPTENNKRISMLHPVWE